MDHKRAMEFRKKHHISQSDFGLLLGLLQGNWARIESGKIRMTKQQARSVEILEELAEQNMLDIMIGKIKKRVQKEEGKKLVTKI